MVIDAASLERAVINAGSGFRYWAETYARIKNKDGQLEAWRLNHLQKQFADAIEWCLDHDRPMRIITLKPRQKGSSTGWMGVVAWISRVLCREVLIVGGEYSQTNNMWEQLRRFFTTDGYPWDGPAAVAQKAIRLTNGSLVRPGTARDAEEGRSGTYQGLICTEAARWSEYGVANAEGVLGGMMNCVPFRPRTLVVLESTAKGPSGVFYETWTHPDTQFLDDVKARDNRGWIRIFSPWYVFEDSADDLTREDRQDIMDTLTEEERGIMARCEVNGQPVGPRQIAFRRRTIRDELKGDVNAFRREFPETWEEAFAASSPSFFSADGLAVMERHMGEMEPGMGGVLDPVGNRRGVVAFSPVIQGQPMWIQYESPVQGRRYVIGADFMSGLAEDEKGTNRDHHAVVVLRQGYHDAKGWHPPKIVMRTVWPCQWHADIIAEQTMLAHQYYGRAYLVPELNCGAEIIRDLVDWGAVVHEARRGVDVSQEVRKAKGTGRYGFRTVGGGEDTKGTRRWLLNQLNQQVRDHDAPTGGLRVDRRTLKEMGLFVQHKDGNYRALQGEHDDSVMALALAFALVDAATPYVPPGGTGTLGWTPGAGKPRRERPFGI